MEEASIPTSIELMPDAVSGMSGMLHLPFEKKV